MKLANWNLERAKTARREGLRRYIDHIAADVWVFTETNDDFAFGDDHRHKTSSAGGRDQVTGLDELGDRWVAIQSKYPLTPLQSTDDVRTVAARVLPPEQAPFLIFGTVLPWIGDRWRGFPAASGVAFREALKVQTSDWKDMRQNFPDDELFVIGDFNQDLVHPHYYGSNANKDALNKALDDGGLVALTGGDDDPIRRDSPPYACIDHICALRDSHWRAKPAVRWPEAPTPDKRLSDHFGVAVSLNHD
jgi:hypothetical protein